ncbi:thioredoxin domain-containing protein [Flavobacterium caeni]|uniref:Thioredoxin n=1 Tax=Flavobacterium caeni TaxID=490189 RepID=A0A1G5FUM3_9FLAO|nr:thioredoxin domain-containing protein [Flavobacterium caeni]SCY43072.1 thioredoxin [Flavobacterium caeni]
MKKQILAFFSAALLFWNCSGQPAKNVENISALALSEQLKKDPKIQLIDVRTPGEYAGGHIADAPNIDWNGDNFEQKVAVFDKTKPVYVYCKVGGRSTAAGHKLLAMGFTEVYNLEGGILKWDAAGLSDANDKIVGMCSQEFAELIQSDQKVFVNFYAPWCEPCKKMAPYMDQLGEKYKGKLTVARLNADEHKTLVRDMKVDTLPLVQLYENGKVVWQHSGYLSEAELQKHLP